MTELPCWTLKAELERLARVHRRNPFEEGKLHVTWRDGLLCVAVSFPDGMAWEVPLDNEAQDIIRAMNHVKH